MCLSYHFSERAGWKKQNQTGCVHCVCAGRAEQFLEHGSSLRKQKRTAIFKQKNAPPDDNAIPKEKGHCWWQTYQMKSLSLKSHLSSQRSRTICGFCHCTTLCTFPSRPTASSRARPWSPTGTSAGKCPLDNSRISFQQPLVCSKKRKLPSRSTLLAHSLTDISKPWLKPTGGDGLHGPTARESRE